MHLTKRVFVNGRSYFHFSRIRKHRVWHDQFDWHTIVSNLFVIVDVRPLRMVLEKRVIVARLWLYHEHTLYTLLHSLLEVRSSDLLHIRLECALEEGKPRLRLLLWLLLSKAFTRRSGCLPFSQSTKATMPMCPQFMPMTRYTHIHAYDAKRH